MVLGLGNGILVVDYVWLSYITCYLTQVTCGAPNTEEDTTQQQQQLDRLLKLQKRAARIILDMPPDAPSMPLFQKLGWFTIYERLEYNKAIVLYKSTHGLTPSYISDLFEFPSTERYNVRSVSNNDMLIKRHST